MRQSESSSVFEEQVRLKYQLYNSLFLTLPFDLIHQTGTLLPLLAERCEQGFKEGESPENILHGFFDEYLPNASARDQTDVLFNFVKYIERQVVLFDAIEEAAFDAVHDMEGSGTLDEFLNRVKQEGAVKRLQSKLSDFRLHLVLTAHPTQFYPGTVLGIITDLASAIRNNDIAAVKEQLLQLGMTPFINQEKPTPLDEARSLIWYLANVFYHAIPSVIRKLSYALTSHQRPIPDDEVITLGFWPGGDRDGNPFVTTQITMDTMGLLHRAIATSYHQEVRDLRRKLTFKGVHERIVEMEYHLFDNIHNGPHAYENAGALLKDVDAILSLLRDEHSGLFAELVEAFRMKVHLFGFHFATLDIRQDSRKHEALMLHLLQHRGLLDTFRKLDEADKIGFLQQTDLQITTDDAPDDLGRDIIGSIKTLHDIQETYGMRACHRYIISNARNALDVVILQTLVKWVQGDTSDVDIVPLFESVDTLRECGSVMELLYTNPVYAHHLAARKRHQTIMLGFSDGTKDGGYLRANWSIFRAKEALTAVARHHDVHVVFFDGRGGPPARGGGNTHKFYSSLGATIENHEVQITVQGQTISSHFGSQQSAVYNLEQLFTAGLENALFKSKRTLSREQKVLIDRMAETSYAKYAELKQRPDFLDYLEEVGTLDYYGQTNIGSRPVKRGGKSKLSLDNLRAIPFVSSWSQLKQNVPGYYGFGHALEAEDQKNGFRAVRQLYQRSQFFQTLVSNSMQSLSKCFFPLTAYLEKDTELGPIWKMLYEEYHLSLKMLLKLAHQHILLEDSGDIRESIRIREAIILPVLTIQQAAIQKLREGGLREEEETVYRKLILRTMYGIINAGRNSA